MDPIIDQIISNEIKIEGHSSNVVADHGGQTVEGISKVSNPDLFKDGPPTDAQVRERYATKYVYGPGFDKIKDPHLMAQMVDMGVNSGPMVAIMKLQEILKVKVDGIIGHDTLTALQNHPPEYVNNRLVVARVLLIGRIISKNPSQVIFLNGWLSRTVDFLV